MAKDKSILPDLVVKGIKKLQNLIGPSDYQKMLRAEVDIVMRTYLPDLPKECAGDVNGEEMISQIYYIFDGLKEYYVNLEQLWGSVGDFEKHISQKVFQRKIILGLLVYNLIKVTECIIVFTSLSQ